jgi:hypothetical protein
MFFAQISRFFSVVFRGADQSGKLIGSKTTFISTQISGAGVPRKLPWLTMHLPGGYRDHIG